MIVVKLDELIRKRSIRSIDLAQKINISENNLSKIRAQRIKALRFSTLNALCRELNCKPGDLLDYLPDEKIDEI